MQQQQQNVDEKSRPEENNLPNREEGKKESHDQEKNLESEKICFGIHQNSSDSIEENKLEMINNLKQPNTSIPLCKIVFLGHVDCGKMTICRDMLYLTGAIDKKKLTELQPFYQNRYSMRDWLQCLVHPPSEEEEDICLKTPNKNFRILNNFLNWRSRQQTFLMGATQLDGICLVVSAALGEFEAGYSRGGLTREYLKFAIVTGISQLVIIVNKMDDRSVLWSQERYQEIQNEITRLINKLQPNGTNVHFIPVSALYKENIMGGIAHPLGSWYKGPTLLKLLDHLPTSGDSSGPLRVSISEKTQKSDSLVQLIGKVESGTLTSGNTNWDLNKLFFIRYGANCHPKFAENNHERYGEC